jgi:hypothetical protein
MADLTPADIAAIVAALQLPKVRINELPAYNVYGELAVDDRMPVWMSEYNKTVWAPLTVIRTLLLTRGGLSQPPFVNGNSIVVEVTALEAGGTSFPIPALAGQQFILRRTVIGALKNVEYEILDAGGFKLVSPDDRLTLGERFEIQLVNSLPVVGNTGTATSGGGYSGVKVISSNTTIGPSDIGKLMQIRAGSSQINIALPAIETIPANSIVSFESSIGNTRQSSISTSNGQFIYFQNTSLSKIHIGISETLSLFRGEDGYYVLPGSFGNWMTVGDTTYKYKAGLNEVLLDGSPLIRTEHPRLFEYASSLGSSIVSDADWLLVDPSKGQINRGCFSYGDGTTTFRVPNLLDMFIRGIKSLSGSDPNRPSNKPGGYQRDMVGAITGDITTDKGFAYTGGPNNTVFGNGAGSVEKKKASISIDTGNSETTVKNVGLLPIMKE